ncbi:hypothetical protein [Pimelobacter simplex]|uniref:hypothetical protein n=1 Tax=Nocardioides simplex TaxID=2045 RepID=UPI001933C5CB|nr:hypothetical protein [Pimelobacter simplex]
MAEQPSLYDNAVPSNGYDPGTRPDPGTAITASYETIDNDRAPMMTFSGVVR